MLVLWAGILALIAALARQTIAGAAMAGGLIGATVMTRVDGTAYLIPVVVAAGWMWVGNRRRQGAVLLVAAALPALVGAADGRWFTGAYYADLSWSRRQLTALLLVASVVTVIAALLRRSPSAGDGLVPPTPRGDGVGCRDSRRAGSRVVRSSARDD